MAYHGCEICKQPIEPERFVSDPKTRLCVEHAAAIKKYGGEFKLDASEEKTSKATSLKHNYGGGISVTRIRNQEGIDQLREDYLAQKHGT